MNPSHREGKPMATERLIVIGGDAAGMSAAPRQSVAGPSWISSSSSEASTPPFPPEGFPTTSAGLSTLKRS